MERKKISGIILVLLLASMLAMANSVRLAGTPTFPDETTVAVKPPVSTANPPPAPGSNQYFTINFTVANITDLFGWQVKMRWPIGFLEVDTSNVTEGPFLQQGGNTFFVKVVNPSFIDIAATGLVPFTPASGSGTLADATFKVLKPGNATLELFFTKFLDMSLKDITHTPISGSVYTTFPVADFTFAPDPAQYPGHPVVGEMVTFNGSASHDPDEPYDSTPGGIVSYEWNFNDGSITTLNSPVVTHRYTEPGEYRVILSVIDDDGESYSVDHPLNGTSVIVHPAPPLTAFGGAHEQTQNSFHKH